MQAQRGAPPWNGGCGGGDGVRASGFGLDDDGLQHLGFGVADRATVLGESELVILPKPVPSDLQETLDGSTADDLAELVHGSDAYFFIGRGYGYPVALEGALKFKEISYEHAEGFAAGELKHGPLALVTPDTPVFAVFTGMHTEKMLNNVKEVQSRGAPVVAIVSEEDEEVRRVADAVLTFPDAAAYASGIMANVQLQLLSYYAADRLGRPIDKPRNLAKSVTVE